MLKTCTLILEIGGSVNKIVNTNGQSRVSAHNGRIKWWREYARCKKRTTGKIVKLDIRKEIE